MQIKDVDHLIQESHDFLNDKVEDLIESVLFYHKKDMENMKDVELMVFKDCLNIALISKINYQIGTRVLKKAKCDETYWDK